jgi:hypothetical protein
MQLQDRELYDVVMAARRVKRSRNTIYLWMNAGMPYRTIGAHRYISHDDLLAMLRAKIMRQRETRWKAGGLNPRVTTAGRDASR